MDLLPPQRLQLGHASVGCELSRPGCLGCPSPNPAPAPAPAPSLPLTPIPSRSDPSPANPHGDECLLCEREVRMGARGIPWATSALPLPSSISEMTGEQWVLSDPPTLAPTPTHIHSGDIYAQTHTCACAHTLMTCMPRHTLLDRHTPTSHLHREAHTPLLPHTQTHSDYVPPLIHAHPADMA